MPPPSFQGVSAVTREQPKIRSRQASREYQLLPGNSRKSEADKLPGSISCYQGTAELGGRGARSTSYKGNRRDAPTPKQNSKCNFFGFGKFFRASGPKTSKPKPFHRQAFLKISRAYFVSCLQRLKNITL